MASDARIREVWAHNMAIEMATISELVVRYDHVAVDSEFPGVVVRPVIVGGSVPLSPRDNFYQTVRLNVDLLNIIQLGLTLCDRDGNTPPDVCTWQFNFRFDLARDMYAQDSVDLLHAHGVDFAAHRENGIEPVAFAEILIASGLVLVDGVTWVSFHGGYDFAYLMKLLTTLPLPSSEHEYFDLLSLYFPRFFDLKCLIREADKYHGGLNAIAEQLGVPRIGTSHQAGSDSLLTMNLFWRLAKDNFDGVVAEEQCGSLYGLGGNTHAQYVPHPAEPSLPPEQTTPNGNHAPPHAALDVTPVTAPPSVQPDPAHAQVAAS